MQTKLEKTSIAKRNETIIKNDFIKSDEYSSNHEAALSGDKPLGKGNGDGGITHTRPGGNFVSSPDKIGGLYDRKGRNGVGGRDFSVNINTYNTKMEYGAHLIDCSENLRDGQVSF